MAANFAREESIESLEPRSESDSYATSEEKTDSGLVPSSNDTSDTSIPTSDTSGVQSHDISPAEPQVAVPPSGGSTDASGGGSTGKSPGKHSLISKAKDFYTKVARSFSPKKDAMEDDATSPKAADVENESSQAKKPTTPKKSLIQKCVDIISPKKTTCGLEASNPCESMDVDQAASDSNDKPKATESKPSGDITLHPEDQGENKPVMASPSEISSCSTMEGIETDLSSPSSTDEPNRMSEQQEMAQVQEQMETPKDTEGDKDGPSSGKSS